jgi:dTDP-4-dehydrorhamnose reductase
MTALNATITAELATAVFLVSAERCGLSARVVPITGAEYQITKTRPAHSQFDCAKVARVHGVSLPHWQSSLAACVGRILEQGA